MAKWYEEKGEFSDVVISSRLRYARNLRKYPFSIKLKDEQAEQLVNEVENVFKDYQDEDGKMMFCRLSKLSGVEKYALVERHVLSPTLADKKQEAGVLLSPTENYSVLINEEEHLRIQVLCGGMNMRKAYEKANEIDDFISGKMDVAFDTKYGYLTTCPTNLGTGLRASYMIFVPALEASGKLQTLAQELAKYGVTLRGTYGEGSQPVANIYQISNQRSLGESEEGIMNNINDIVMQVVKQERKHREYLLMNSYDTLEDQVYRSYGVLKYARQINTKDAMILLAQIKFGFDTGILASKDYANMYQLMMEIQSCNIAEREGRKLGTAAREKARAAYINTHLPELV
ncbi:MAG: protein arginine kinase [Lachnospiraceae bacterium]|nr:protein arginine kinase [Lachnospiraceae bacterium]